MWKIGISRSSLFLIEGSAAAIAEFRILLMSLGHAIAAGLGGDLSQLRGHAQLHGDDARGHRDDRIPHDHHHGCEQLARRRDWGDVTVELRVAMSFKPDPKFS